MATARPMARPTARPTARSAASAARPPARSSGYSGAAAIAAMERAEEEHRAAEETRKQNANMPFRYYTPVGESREVVVIDASIQEAFFRYEHCLQNPRSGKWDVYTACLKEHCNCPACTNTARPSYFVMLLTVIDLTPYETRDGEEVPWSKKLLAVKLQQQKKFLRLEEKIVRETGLTMRGAILRLTRDTEKDYSIGNEIEYIEHMSEEDLLTYETSYVDQSNRTHDVIGHQVFDYDDLFPMPTEQMLRAIVGGKAGAGTTQGDDDAIGRSRGRAASRPAARGDDWEDARPARGAAPAVRRAARSVAPQEDDTQEEAAPPSRAARPSRAATPPPPARRMTPTNRPAPARVAAEAPPATSSLAARRAALRR